MSAFYSLQNWQDRMQSFNVNVMKDPLYQGLTPENKEQLRFELVGPIPTEDIVRDRTAYEEWFKQSVETDPLYQGLDEANRTVFRDEMLPPMPSMEAKVKATTGPSITASLMAGPTRALASAQEAFLAPTKIIPGVGNILQEAFVKPALQTAEQLEVAAQSPGWSKMVWTGAGQLAGMGAVAAPAIGGTSAAIQRFAPMVGKTAADLAASFATGYGYGVGSESEAPLKEAFMWLAGDALFKAGTKGFNYLFDTRARKNAFLDYATTTLNLKPSEAERLFKHFEKGPFMERMRKLGVDQVAADKVWKAMRDVHPSVLHATADFNRVLRGEPPLTHDAAFTEMARTDPAITNSDMGFLLFSDPDRSPIVHLMDEPDAVMRGAEIVLQHKKTGKIETLKIPEKGGEELVAKAKGMLDSGEYLFGSLAGDQMTVNRVLDGTTSSQEKEATKWMQAIEAKKKQESLGVRKSTEEQTATIVKPTKPGKPVKENMVLTHKMLEDKKIVLVRKKGEAEWTLAGVMEGETKKRLDPTQTLEQSGLQIKNMAQPRLSAVTKKKVPAIEIDAPIVKTETPPGQEPAIVQQPTTAELLKSELEKEVAARKKVIIPKAVEVTDEELTQVLDDLKKQEAPTKTARQQRYEASSAHAAALNELREDAKRKGYEDVKFIQGTYHLLENSGEMKEFPSMDLLAAHIEDTPLSKNVPEILTPGENAALTKAPHTWTLGEMQDLGKGLGVEVKATIKNGVVDRILIGDKEFASLKDAQNFLDDMAWGGERHTAQKRVAKDWKIEVDEIAGPHLEVKGWDSARGYVGVPKHWFAWAEQELGVPFYSMLYTPIEDGMRSAAKFVDPHYKTLLDIFKGMHTTEREDFLYLMEAKDKKAFVSEHGLPESWLKKAEDGRQWLNNLFGEFGLDPANFLEEYMPWLRKMEFKEFDRAYRNNRLPGALSFFAEHIRSGDIPIFRETDAFKLMRAYLYSGAKKKFVGPAYSLGRDLVEMQRYVGGKAAGYVIPETIRFPAVAYLKDIWGVPDISRKVLEATIEGFPGMEKGMGKDVISAIISYNYGTNLSARPSSVLKNFTQHGFTYAMLGGKYFALGLAKGHTAEGLALAREAGALMKEKMHVPYAYETEQIGKSALRAMTKVHEPGMKLWNFAEDLLRSTACNGAFLKFMDAYTSMKGELSTEFLRRSGLNVMSEPIQSEVLSILATGGPREAALTFGRHMSEDTQWIYRRGNSPTAFRSGVGRLAGMYGTWPANALDFIYRTRQLPGAAKYRVLGRLLSWNLAIMGVGTALGLDLRPWTLLPGLSWGGSPLVTMGPELLRGLSQPKQAGQKIVNFAKQWVPYKGAIADIKAGMKAGEEQGSPYGFLRYIGAKKGEE